MNRARALAKGLVAAVALAALLGGVPWALSHFVGWPLPHRLPSWSQLTTALGQHGIADTTLLKALACVVWVCWAVLAVSVAVELDAAVRGRAARRLAVVGPLQLVVAQLLAAIVVAAVALAPRPGVPPRPLAAAFSAGRRPLAVAAVALISDPNPARLLAAGPEQPPAGGAQLSTYVVQRNDTLWGIAERELGDPLRWTEIYALNEGRSEPDGMTLADPNWIYPGWTLLLPASTAPAPPSGAAGPPPINTRPPATDPSAAPTPRSPPPTPVRQRPDNRPGQGEHQRSAATAASAAVELPSGSLVAASFAAGLLSAVAIGRFRRRHGYRPSPPEAGRALGPPPLGPTIRRLAAALAPRDDEADAGEGSPRFDDAQALPEDDAAHRERPDLLEIGERGGTSVTVMVSEVGGVALHGTDVDEVARAWLAALLTRSGSIAAEMLVATDSMGRLFPGMGEVPGIRVVAGPEQVVRILEAEVVGRTRKLDAEGLDDIVAYRRANPAEPVPSVLAVMDAVPADWAARLRSILEAGTRLGVGAIFLDKTEAAVVHLELDHSRVVAVEPSERTGQLFGTRLFSLDVTEATDALGALVRAEFRPTSEENPEWTEVIERMEHPPPTTEPWPEDVVADRVPVETPVVLRVLGPLAISVGGKTIGRGLRSVAKELLTFYLLHPEGASVEQAVDTLWPDTDRKQVHRQFWTAAGNLRSRLREAGTETKVLDQAGEVYRLDPDVVSADLWDFQRALADAARATDDRGAADVLRRAAESFGGDLVHGSGWLWVEPSREDLHRRAVDAHLRLAELEERLGNPAAAETVLERVVNLDRYGEEPYRRLMALQAKGGRVDAVKATWRLLQRRLLDLDLDPDPSSGQLYRALTGSDGASGRRERSERSP